MYCECTYHLHKQILRSPFEQFKEEVYLFFFVLLVDAVNLPQRYLLLPFGLLQLDIDVHEPVFELLLVPPLEPHLSLLQNQHFSAILSALLRGSGVLPCLWDVLLAVFGGWLQQLGVQVVGLADAILFVVLRLGEGQGGEQNSPAVD